VAEPATGPPPAATADADADPHAAPDPATGRPSWIGRHGPPFLELFVLCGFVVAQPVLDVTGRSPDFFLVNGAGRSEVLLLLATVLLAPAVLLWLVETAAGLAGPRAGRAVHLVLVGGLATVGVVEVVKKLSDVRGALLVAVGVAGGVAAVGLYARLAAARLWLRYLTPAPLVFALLFVVASPSSSLVLPGGDRPAGAAAGAVGNGTPLVMITLDEFPLNALLDRDGRIDARVFPNFARLAQGSTWYRNATGVSGWTPWAMPAMLTGRYPARIRAPHYAEYPDNLFTLLSGSYDLEVLETISLLCPPRSCTGGAATTSEGGRGGLRAVLGDSARALRGMVSPNDEQADPTAAYREQTLSEREGAQPRRPARGSGVRATFRFDQLGLNQPERFSRFLGSIVPSDRPTVHFLHLLLPHGPWRYLPSGMQYGYPSRSPGVAKAGMPWPAQLWPTELARQRLLLQLAYTDRLIGKAVERLRAQGLYDKALVVVTADHGISLTPGRVARKLAGGSPSELLWVPLFVKLPGQQEGRVDDRNWEHVDLVPTIADVLDVEVPWAMEGVSGVGPDRRPRTQKFFYDVPGRRLVVDGPPNLTRALRGPTDTVARAREGPAGLFKVGPFADLVGKPVDPRWVVDGGGAAKVHDLAAFAHVEPGRGKVPALVWGELTSRGGAGTPAGVVVALNGTVAGGGPTFPERDTTRFAAVVPDRLFVQGANRLELFLAEGATVTAGIRLHRVALTGE
jgi:hypothetical protein